MHPLAGLTVAIAATLLCIATPAAEHAMRVHFLDVGQGSATLIESECGAVLVDSGGENNNDFDSTQALIDEIEEFFFAHPNLDRTFDLFVLTHPHADHTRGAYTVLEKFKVRNAVTNGQEAGSGKPGQKSLHRAVALSEESGGTPIGFEPIRVAELSEYGLSNEIVSPLDCGGNSPKITALWGTADTRGWPAKDARNQNNHSVVMRVDYGSASLLLTGDLEERGIAGLLAKYAGTGMLDTDVYLVGHHGAANATTTALLRAVSPKVAVISMGDPDRKTSWTAWAYGHPRKSIVQQLNSHVAERRPARKVSVATGVHAFQTISINKAIYATGWDGTVVMEATADGDWKRIRDPSPTVASPRNTSAQPQGPRKVDLNSASADELDALPMIGLDRAKRIVAYRAANGRFESIDDLTKVQGIGPGTMKEVRPLIEAR